MARWIFRHGEIDRIRHVRHWISSTRNLEVLDAGCGDGRFLMAILSGPPRSVRLVDLVAKNVETAVANLRGSARVVEGVVADALIGDGHRFDIVLAIGMLDYQRDWQRALSVLAGLSRGVLVADLPRACHPRNLLRYIWLGLNGIRLSFAPKHTIIAALRALGIPFELESTPLEWFFCLHCQGGSSHEGRPDESAWPYSCR
jgi:SAM-dependent methyltransferase